MTIGGVSVRGTGTLGVAMARDVPSDDWRYDERELAGSADDAGKATRDLAHDFLSTELLADCHSSVETSAIDRATHAHQDIAQMALEHQSVRLAVWEMWTDIADIDSRH